MYLLNYRGNYVILKTLAVGKTVLKICPTDSLILWSKQGWLIVALNTGLIICKSNVFPENKQITLSKVKQNQRSKHRNELVNNAE